MRLRRRKPAADTSIEQPEASLGGVEAGEMVRIVPPGSIPAAPPAPRVAEAPAAVPSGGRVGALVIADEELDDYPGLPPAGDPDGSGALPIDPRLRRRRIDVRRAAGRRRLIVALVLGGVILLIVGVLAVLGSTLFSVKTVQVQGAAYTSDQDLAPIIAEAKGHAILTLDTDHLAQEIEQLPWVLQAQVETDFPSTLKIDISERQPIASFQGSDAQWRVIDRDGRVIAVIDGGAQPTDYLPIEGTGPAVGPGALAGDNYRVAAELAMSLPAELRALTSSITLTPSGELGLRLTTGTSVGFGPPSDLRTKLAVLITLLRKNDPAKLSALNLADPYNPGMASR